MDEPFTRISVDQAIRMDGALIDVRRPDEYVKGHAEGAVLIGSSPGMDS